MRIELTRDELHEAIESYINEDRVHSRQVDCEVLILSEDDDGEFCKDASAKVIVDTKLRASEE